MSINTWAKRSPSSNSWILAVVIGAISLNIYYRDRPDRKAESLTATSSGDIALVSASPKVKAFLKTIRWAEGTDSKDGYRMMFTGIMWDKGFADHPRIINCTEDRVLCSDVFGAYQFLSLTWDGKAKKLGLKDISPKSQDIAAIDLLNDVHAISLIEKDDIEGAISKASTIWASLPKKGGGSVYKNQKARPMAALLQRYREALQD